MYHDEEFDFYMSNNIFDDTKANIIDQSFGKNTFDIDILNNILIFSSLYLFYTIPFYINNFSEIKKKSSKI